MIPARTLVALVLLSPAGAGALGLPAALASQGRVVGRVVEPNGDPIREAEVILTRAARRALTGPDGRFTLVTADSGTDSMLVRRPGYGPYRAALALQPGVLDLAEIVLHRLPVVLPDVPVESSVRAPTMNLQVLKDLQQPLLSRREAVFEPWGASLHAAGFYAAIGRYAAGSASRREYRVITRRSGRGLSGSGSGCRTDGRPVATQFDSETESFRTLDRAGNVWVYFPWATQPGPCVRQVRLDHPGEISVAVPAGDGWVVLQTDRSTPVLAFYGASGRLRGTVRIPSQGSGSSHGLSPGRTGPIVWSCERVPAWVELDTTGVERVTVRVEGDALSELDRRLGGGAWETVAVLPIDRGYVQTMATRELDRRAHLLFDVTGRLVDVRVGSLPLLIASSHESRQILGIRVLNRRPVELMAYSY